MGKGICKATTLYQIINNCHGRAPIILATQEAENRRIEVQTRQGK
jgi:hypothetical protein